MRVRRLIPGDVAAFRGLNAMLGVAFDDPASFDSAPPSDAWLERLLAREHIIPLIAEQDGEVAGGLVAYVLEKFEQARSEVYIYDLAVAEAHRRQGIATALIEVLKRIAAEIGAWVIFVQGDCGDDPALALYDKLGVREEVVHFDIAVPRSE